MHLFYDCKCCKFIFALSKHFHELSPAELFQREHGAQCWRGGGEERTGRHKLPCGAKLSKSQSSIPGWMDMNGYRWMCVNNLHYSHV